MTDGRVHAWTSKNPVIVMTSSLGSQMIQDMAGAVPRRWSSWR